jgi:type II secretory pathway pseudopilin PulG
MRRLRAGRAARPDSGSTLVELMVVMFIMGIVVAATVTLTIGFQRSNAQNISRQDQIDAARTAVERVSKTVRSAVMPSQLNANCAACIVDAFVTGQNFTMQFYADLDNSANSVGPSKVVYTVASSGPDAGVLIETIQIPTSPYPTATGYPYCDPATAGCQAYVTTRRITSGVITSGAPLFKYYDITGARLIPAASGLSTAQLDAVLSVELVIQVQSTNVTKAATTTYIQRVTLPNSQAVHPPDPTATP